MKTHIYRSHVGDVYWVNEKADESELICSVCGGIDEYLGEANSLEEFIKIINSAGARFSYLFKNEIEQAFENSLTVCNVEGKIYLATTETQVEGELN